MAGGAEVLFAGNRMEVALLILGCVAFNALIQAAMNRLAVRLITNSQTHGLIAIVLEQMHMVATHFLGWQHAGFALAALEHGLRRIRLRE